MQATQRRRILLMSLAICSWGILLHSSCKAVPKAWSVLGRETLCRTRWPRMSQTCSIGDKSGDRAGQSRWSTLFCCRNCCTILARWGIVLSSCSTTWCCWTKGRTTGCSTSLMKRWPVIVPFSTSSSVRERPIPYDFLLHTGHVQQWRSSRTSHLCDAKHDVVCQAYPAETVTCR